MNRSLQNLFHSLDRPSSVLTATFVGAFLETTVLPVPFELLLVPLMLRYHHLVWLIVAAALAGCMLGAYAGYTVGMFAFQSFGQTALQALGAEHAMESFTARLQENGFWSVFLVGFTPVPVQVATLGAGFTSLSLATFTLAMLVSRGLRYGALGVMVHVFGERARLLLLRHRRKALVIGLLLMGVLAYLLFGPEATNAPVAQ